MYPTVDEARALLDEIQSGLLQRVRCGITLPLVIVCPPFVSLVPLRAMADGGVLRLGAQDCHWEQRGPHTAETSPRMLEGLVDYVMVGHSDRRAAGDTDARVAAKVATALGCGLVPILFVGEEDRGGAARDPVGQTEQRLRQGLAHVDVASEPVLVVYEPAWAIGADQTAPAAHVARVVAHLKGVLEDLGSKRPEVIYGGSVAEANIDDLLEVQVLDGIGATRASLDADHFLQIVDRVAASLRSRLLRPVDDDGVGPAAE